MAGMLPHEKRVARKLDARARDADRLTRIYAAALIAGGSCVAGSLGLTFSGKKVDLQEWARLVAWRALLDCRGIEQ